MRHIVFYGIIPSNPLTCSEGAGQKRSHWELSQKCEGYRAGVGGGWRRIGRGRGVGVGLGVGVGVAVGVDRTFA